MPVEWWGRDVATYRESVTLAQRLLGDPLGLKWKEGMLAPLLTEAVRACQRRLAENGMQVLRGIQLVTLPASTTSMTLLTTPALASDFVLPWQLEEKQGGTSGKYVPMEKDEQLLPDIDVAPLLRVWNWRGNALTFVGSNRIVDVKISYEKELPIPSALTETVPFVGGSSAIAYKIAELAGGPWAPNFEDAIAGVISSEVRANQWKPVRRIPYSRR